MRNIFALTALLMALPCSSKDSEPALPLKLEMTCGDQTNCVFSDLPILLKMKLTNVSKKSIVCSLNFLDVKGPYITLVGEDTKKTISIPASVPPPSSEITFTEIGPNGFWHLEAVLHARELRRLFNSNKAIRIEVVAHTIGKDPETMQKTICSGESQIDLIGPN